MIANVISIVNEIFLFAQFNFLTTPAVYFGMGWVLLELKSQLLFAPSLSLARLWRC